MSEPPILRLVHHMARTGGTTISKCLAVMPEVALLSEIHPLGMDQIDPMQQASEWYGLADPVELDHTGVRPDLAAAIRLLAARAEARGLRLVIRDWSHLDFTGPPFVRTPSFRSMTVETLAAHFRLRRIATVRHPIDQWQSLRRVPIMRGQIDLGRFLFGYRRFAELSASIGFVRFEDFCRDSDLGLRRLCEALDITFDPGWRARWASYDRMTGDDTATHRSDELKLPRRKLLEPGLADSFLANSDYRPALELLGYGHPV